MQTQKYMSSLVRVSVQGQCCLAAEHVYGMTGVGWTLTHFSWWVGVQAATLL